MLDKHGSYPKSLPPWGRGAVTPSKSAALNPKCPFSSPVLMTVFLPQAIKKKIKNARHVELNLNVTHDIHTFTP